MTGCRYMSKLVAVCGMFTVLFLQYTVIAAENVRVLYPVGVIQNLCVCVGTEWPRHRFMSVSSCRRVDLFKCLH